MSAMDTATLVKISKFLSFVLRHKPDAIGLELSAQGWVEVDQLIRAAREAGTHLDRELIREVVEKNDKRRFTLSEDEKRIRANQGHSIEVDLELEPVVPPAMLYHGTATRYLASIREQGLLPGGRNHVHLSPDERTATAVGRRHGKPVVLKVRARQMHEQGYAFYLSENGVWLTERVPAAFLELP
jgi:putative RNA 2'-phosphotransferase